jgi:hypothetical protein
MHTNATHRDGQRGELGALDQNGFGVFESETGARFTVHALEAIRDAETDGNGKALIWHGWPSGCLMFAVNAKRELTVARTPTAAQCNAKRSAANAARLADAERRVQS